MATMIIGPSVSKFFICSAVLPTKFFYIKRTSLVLHDTNRKIAQPAPYDVSYDLREQFYFTFPKK